MLFLRLTLRKPMRKTLLLAVLATIRIVPAFAQNHVDEAYVDIRTGFAQSVQSGEYQGGFHVDYLNIHLKGHVSDNIIYVLRHRLTKAAYSEKNPLNATDFAWMTWQASQKFSLTAGKHPVWFGSFEFDDDPIDVFYWSKSIADLYQYFTLGVTGTYEVAPFQSISLQFSQSPLSRGITNCFSYSLYWNGRIAPFWKTTWSINFVDNELGTMMNYIVLGNRFFIDNLQLDADFINKVALANQQKPFFSDGAIMLNSKYKLGKFNLCAKATYDFNEAGNGDFSAGGIGSWDVVVPAGYEAWQFAAGFEYFPLGNKNLRIHAFYDRISTLPDRNALELGLTWRFDLFKR